MKAVNSMLQKVLGMTSDGKCIRHPQVTICEEDSSVLLECASCWKEQHDHSGIYIRTSRATLDSANNHNSGSLASESAVLPPALKTVVSVSTTAAVTGAGKQNASAAMMDSVMARWKQMLQVGANDDCDDGDNEDGAAGADDGDKDQLSLLMEDTNLGHDTMKCDNYSSNINVNNNKNVQNTAEESPALSHRNSTTKNGLNEEAIHHLQNLERRMQQQEASIQRLQQSVEQHHATVEMDIQQVLVAVMTMARHHGLAGSNSQLNSSLTTSNTASNNMSWSHNLPPPRPAMFNQFRQQASVRSMERTPPKPPVRHNSVSTMSRQSGGVRRGSFATGQSRSHLSSSNVSSLGNSTTIHTESAATGSDLIDSGATEPVLTQDNAGINPTPTPYYGPELVSMLEQERQSKKHLDIIFDASAGNWSSRSSIKYSEEEDKKTDSKEGSNTDNAVDNNLCEPNVGATTPVSDLSPRTGIERKKKLQELHKTGGSISLDIPTETESSRSTPLRPLTPVRSRKLNSRSSSPKRPERYPSLNDTFTIPELTGVSNGSPPPSRGTSTPTSANNEIALDLLEGSPPPLLPTMKLQHASPSRKSKPPLKPPRLPSVLSMDDEIPASRREIYAAQSSRMQISCLTIDPAISDKDDDALGAVVYHDVVNFDVMDCCGEKGCYTGTLKELDLDGTTASTGVNDRGKMLLPCGSGTMKYVGGRFYKGEWRDGHWHGRGVLRNAYGDSYEGEFVYDARHGRGIYKYENGDVYEGDFANDTRHGKGTFMFQNGSTYRGDFISGNFEGYGWYEFDEGYYEGEWRVGQYEGIGTLQYADGGSYTGRFLAGKAHGFGEERDADGTIRRGQWRNGELALAP